MLDTAETTGSSLAGNYAVRQAVDVGTDTVLDTVQAVARGEDVNAKTIGRDLLANTLMAGAQVAGGSGKNGIAGTPNNIKPDPDVAGSRSVFKTGSKGASGAKTEPYVPKDASGNPISLQKQRVNGQDIPLPDPAAQGRPHTVLGGTTSSKTGEVYRQSATFPKGTWPKANGQDVPLSEVHWTNHGRGDHLNPHQHIFEYNPDKGGWIRGEPSYFGGK